MAILTVGPNATYTSIANAVAAANSGDSILLEAGYGNETATITVNDVTVDGGVTSTGIILQLGTGVALFALKGEAPIAIRDGVDGNGIVGNAGNNIITVASGVDAVDGGPGIDRLVVDYSLANGSVTGNSTSNFTEAGGGGRSVTITDATIEHFTVLTGAQADTLTTGDGDDLINVAGGANTVTAGEGNNTVTGGADADTFTVGDGDNLIDAGNGANTIIAGQGVNTITAGTGTNTITALDGGNIITGGDGTNIITSGAGADVISAGRGPMTIVAGGGSDLITVKGSPLGTVDAGLGADRVIVDFRDEDLDISGGIAGGSFATGHTGHIEDALSNHIDFVGVENVTYLGGSGRDDVATGDGLDVMEGNDGSDTLTSGGGDDRFTGGAGNDVLDGGADIDTAFYAGARSDYDITFDANGNPILVVDTRANSPDGTDTLTRIEMLNFAINSLPTGTVVITGTPTEDQVLTASHTLADGDGMGAVAYQWQADGADILGATGDSLTLAQAQVGALITVVASYLDGQSTPESAESDPTTAVANLNDLPTGVVTITGTLTQGQILTAEPALADEDGLGTFGYQWRANGADIAGATSATFTLTQAQVNARIGVFVTYIDQQGTPEGVAGAAPGFVANVNDAPAGTVVISGTPTEDQILTASNTLADADGLGAVSYQWRADGLDIAGATSATLALAQAQVGARITVIASYTDGEATPESVASSATAAVANLNDLPTGLVTITGLPEEGGLLTASNTLADEDGLGAVAYQWREDGTDIAGATDATFTLTAEQRGAAIDVLASYTDQQGTAESVASLPVPVAVPPSLPFYQFTMTASDTAGQIRAVAYEGPVAGLTYAFTGSAADEAVFGTASHDFIHLGAGDDAANGGDGDDVLDGGTGSNFLTGGAGRDVFFLDGRNGETTWSTITDWQAGEDLSMWGWVRGVSQATWLENAGTAGYRGVTLHADLDNDGAVDTSVTWAGLTGADLPASTQHDGLLWFA
jgi:Ca2+-binding RTX toxin-like protein